MSYTFKWPDLDPCPNCGIGAGVWAEPPAERRVYRSHIEIVCETCGAVCDLLRTVEQCAYAWNVRRYACSPFGLARRDRLNAEARARNRQEAGR